jgi:16S rRNA processing protein RimM
MVEPGVLPAAEVLRAQIRSLVGFEVIDSELGIIGKMTGLLDIPTNPIIQVSWNKKEVLIPLNENIVTGIDQKQKQILVTTPPGLLDL